MKTKFWPLFKLIFIFPFCESLCDFQFWYIFSGTTTRLFCDHEKDVMSVAFSADNRQIVSGSRDKSIKLWNTLGVCKYTIQVGFQLSHYFIFISSRTTGPISTKHGTKHPLVKPKRKQVCSNDGSHPFSREDDNKIAKIHWQN